ncbi:hypothetical protein H8N00_10585 [Streptomyces sp. AC563]|uniref:hypothetical protein n=1 Tax=Streptomyces buecherae TaxID=2763006 RepID=UPI00164E5E0D|nr:hypothetical protein [Streptomyces buecherae]MBC3989318.1 hypothetical protein [Streptomyces buecherae]
MPTEAEHATPAPYDWVPPGDNMRWTLVGELGWHTLTLPLPLGDRVLAELGDASGAVIREDADRRQSWLIEPKAPAVQHLRSHPEITLSGNDGSFIFVPSLARRHLVWWRIPPTRDRLLTDADLLADAIAALRPGTRR